MKDLNEPQAMHKDLLKHKVRLVRFQWTTEMKNRTHVPDLDMLSMCDLDDLLQSVFVVGDIRGHPLRSLHLDGLKAVKFSNPLASKGLNCLSILM